MPKPVNFGQQRKQAEEAGLLGKGDIYKYQEGDNRIRLMSECLPHTSEYQGQKNFKWLCYVIDRRDGKIKVHFMPHKIYKAIEALQVNEDYAFAEVPMPYDITIKATKAGTKDVEYAVMPARKETPVTEAEERELYKQKPLDELQATLKEKQSKGGAAPAAVSHDEPPHDIGGELTDENIPFAWIAPLVLPLAGLTAAASTVLA